MPHGLIPPGAQNTPLVLVVEPNRHHGDDLCAVLRSHDFEAFSASTTRQASALLAEQRPDLIITNHTNELDGIQFIRQVRSDPHAEEIPIIVVAQKQSMKDVTHAFEAGADDFISYPFEIAELLARIRVKLSRPPTPVHHMNRDRRTGILTEAAFTGPLQREVQRASITRHPLSLASLQLEELPVLRERYGPRLDAALSRQVNEILQEYSEPLDVLGQDGHGHFVLLMPETAQDQALARSGSLMQRIVDHEFHFHGDRLRLTPSVGIAQHHGALPAEELRDHSETALQYASAHLDLQPVLYDPARHSKARSSRQKHFAQLRESMRLPVQMLSVALLLIVLPLLTYALLGSLGLDISGMMFLVVVISLLLTGMLILLEGFSSLNPIQPPEEPGRPYPPASAIIAAYLPNEAATVLETIEAFLRVHYPAGLQVILAYNTPRDLPIEAALHELAARDPRFLPLRVEGSTSKAQNVNAALAHVTGEFTGVYDADHHPDPHTFKRAWRWLSNGWDVVQGHCFIRNGDESWVARLVAVEFESIYAVSHPGRAKMHQFGIFGGSNGFWRTQLLRKIRMHGFMLTEDIDSALRAVEAGYKIGSDPYLISRELAPTTLRALTNQRLRWAQGWFQVSLKHLSTAWRSPHLSVRQKLGFFHLLGWREFYPWLSVQALPIILYWLFLDSRREVDWLVPIFVLSALFTLSVGPAQTLFAYLRAEPGIRRNRRWFWFYLAVSSVFYTPFKNLLAVVAQLKEIRRERAWKVTPRTTRGPGD